MKIGIDISQIAYEGTGVAQYTRSLVESLLKIDKENEYILFFSSFRKNFKSSIFSPSSSFGEAGNFKSNSNVKIKKFKFPSSLLDLLWNKFHIFPIEWLIGDIDVFISSDWTQPPTVKAKKATILYDLIVYKYKNETDGKIVSVQRRRLKWVKKECDYVICISESTKKDAIEILGIDKKKITTIYPGI